MTERKVKMTETEIAAEQAAIAASIQAAKENKEHQEKLLAYEKSVKKMSFRQLRGELRREARRPRDGSPLTAGLASVLKIVLENTQTRENPFAKLVAYPR